MSDIDLNLLVALEALLVTGSVAAAARRLGLSASAMSRTLARLRSATGDQLLVRAGRGLVATPRAIALGQRVPDVLRQARAVLRPEVGAVALASVVRLFTIRASEEFVERFAGAVVAAVGAAAPLVRLRFAPKLDKEAGPIRDGTIDLEVGVIGTDAPEILRQTLFHDRFVGVVRAGHPLLAGDGVTAERYAACAHVVQSRRERFVGPVDEGLAALGLQRRIVAVVPSYRAAVGMALGSELVALAPESCVPAEGEAFALPVATPGITVSALWHPRMRDDPVHRWIRETIVGVCRITTDGPRRLRSR